MGFINDTKKKVRIPTTALFLIAILIILYFLPREGRYKYSYEENKPWQYGLLTAPFNFHIHKSEERIQNQKDSINESLQPYYVVDNSVYAGAINLFKTDSRQKSIPADYVTYINRKLEDVYKAGIISADDYERIQLLTKKQLFLAKDYNTFSNRHLASFYTPKQAYQMIVEDSPGYINTEEIRKMNINNYLNANIIYNDTLSSKMKHTLLSEITLYEGDIQEGEKIVDRGEIIDSHTKAVLDSYSKEVEGKVGTKVKPGWLIAGQLVIVFLLVMNLMVYLRYYRYEVYRDRKKVIFILVMTIFLPIIMGLMVDMKFSNIMYVIPFAIPTILICTFIDSRTAFVTHVVTVLVCALMLPLPQMPQFIVIEILVGCVSIFSLRNLSERSQLVYCSFAILLTYVISFSAWIVATEGDYTLLREYWRMYVYFGINFVFVSFAYILLYVCEKVFGFMSEITMVELSNTSRPLLQELSEVAPGTFQHSLQVSNLVVPAARLIGANAALVRTGALYHDIGKMANPAFFTENQSQGVSPHTALTEKESAKIIIGHVSEGVALAKKHGLPQQIIDFITTHHGKGKAKYFYNSYANSHPDEEIDEADFTYPGPNPFSKETALLMMADGVEATSRSLTTYTEDAISGLVNKIIDGQMNDGLFRDTPLTFKDIQMIKDVFVEKLMISYHTRISYPELDKNKV